LEKKQGKTQSLHTTKKKVSSEIRKKAAVRGTKTQEAGVKGGGSESFFINSPIRKRLNVFHLQTHSSIRAECPSYSERKKSQTVKGEEQKRHSKNRKFFSQISLYKQKRSRDKWRQVKKENSPSRTNGSRKNQLTR